MIRQLKRLIGSAWRYIKGIRPKGLESTVDDSEIRVKYSLAMDAYKDIKTRNRYIDYNIRMLWKHEYHEVYKSSKKMWRVPKDLKETRQQFITLYDSFDAKCNQYNDCFIDNEKRVFKQLFDNVEGRALDDQQRTCVIKDEVNNLVIAGAGSGKTTTIIGKIKYLIERYNYKDEELLVLSYTNASTTEMKERVKKETGRNIDVLTFHKLGQNIITEVEQAKPSTTDIKLIDVVKDTFSRLKEDQVYVHKLTTYFISYFRVYKKAESFERESDYFDHLRGSNLRTFNGEWVKSLEELEIANYLCINRIKYKYEKKYEHNTASLNYSQYKPDFYLPEYEVYIEHFGINRNGDVPPFFTGKDGMSAKQVYHQGIEWKRQTHKRFGTSLVETYSYEKSEGVLLE